MSNTLPQPRRAPKHRKTATPRQSDAIILHFPGSSPMSPPDPWTEVMLASFLPHDLNASATVQDQQAAAATVAALSRADRSPVAAARTGLAIVRDATVAALLKPALP